MATNEFINVEDRGEWLNFRIPNKPSSIPVKITREAMEDHFGAERGEGSLQACYARQAEAINAAVRAKAVPGVEYTSANPLVIRTADL